MLLNNRYKIVTVLGKGLWGETSIAKDTHMPSGRLCIVKKLQPDAFQQPYSVALEMFQQQVFALDMLRHNQLPKIYDYFEWQDEFYLVQEQIEGQTLGAKIRQGGPLTEAETRQFLHHFLAVLSYIHSSNIIHQDIQPDNIILRQEDGKPVLVDFGLFKRVPPSWANDSAVPCIPLTFSERFVSPEQLKGQPINDSSDLYAVGMTAIYALTGILPQDMDRDRQSGQVIWHGCAPTVSEQLADLVDQAIQVDPRYRFGSAIEMMSAITDEQALAATVLPVSDTSNTRANPLTAIPVRRQRRSVISLAAGVAMVLITGVAGAYVYDQSKPEKASTLEGKLERLSQQGKFEDCQATVQRLTPADKARAEIQALLNQCRLGEAKQLAAEGDYAAAVAKAKAIPVNASNRPQVRQSIANWSSELEAQEQLTLATRLVDEGKPKEAINTLMQVPNTTKTASEAWQRIAELSHVELYNNTMEKEPYLQTQQNRNRAVTVATQFGTAEVDRDWERWPKYQLPTPQELKADPSWGDPWREAYTIVPNKMTLEFIYGCKDKNLLQTEVAFAPSTDLKMMQVQLNQMVAGKADHNLQDKLAQVYRGEVSQHTFKTGRFKGVIQRGELLGNRSVILAIRKV